MSFCEYLLQDWRVNRGVFLAQILLMQFRLIQLLQRSKLGAVCAIIPWLVYKIYAQVLLHVELSPRTEVGPGLSLPHPFSIVVNVHSIIGENCILRHNVTIGNKGDSPEVVGMCPVIRDNVDMGCNSIVLGGVTIGSKAVIGAAAVVIKSMPAEAICVGNPARNIRA